MSLLICILCERNQLYSFEFIAINDPSQSRSLVLETGQYSYNHNSVLYQDGQGGKYVVTLAQGYNSTELVVTFIQYLFEPNEVEL